MLQPLVSILLPAYNVGAYISRCLDSIISQSFKNLQIVIVDDGSTDDTLSICKRYEERDRRIEVFHRENAGVASARNDLLRHVRGSFFLFVDSDDWIEPNMVEVLLALIQSNHSDVAICGMVQNEGSISKEETWPCLTLDRKELVRRFLYHTEVRGSLWNKLFRSDLLEDEQFDSSISFGEDALFCWHLFQRVNSITMNNQPLYHYRMNENSISHGVFGSKKLSAHYVWSKICIETSANWPEFLLIAQARHCIEDTLLLRDAARCHYRKMDDIQMLQKTVKSLHPTLGKVKITSAIMRIYSYLIARFYRLARFF